MITKKILIVDDDQDLLRGLNIRLSTCGYRVSLATDAISAISVAREEEPDLVILDIGLPGGDGFMVMQRMSSLRRLATIPIVVLTGRDPLANQERALNAGAQAFLQKPVDNNVLLATISQALGQNGDTQEKEPSTKGDTDMTAKRILIVDDDQDLLRGLNIRLSAYGYKVSFATDAISAISAVREEEPGYATNVIPSPPSQHPDYHSYRQGPVCQSGASPQCWGTSVLTKACRQRCTPISY